MSTIEAPAPIKLIQPTLPKADSCLLVIFGGTGDLTKRKLIPALYDLACIGCTNPMFDVLGIGRTPISDDQFRERMHEGTAKSKDARNYSEEGWRDFSQRLHYLEGDANKPGFYSELKRSWRRCRLKVPVRTSCSMFRLRHHWLRPSLKGLGNLDLPTTKTDGRELCWKSLLDTI